MQKRNVSLIALWVLLGCQPAQPATLPEEPLPKLTATPAAPESQAPLDEYATLPPEQRESPPPSANTPAWSFPAITEATLSNGLQVRVIERHTLPLVEIKLVVLSGQATDGDKHGLAVLSGEMLKVGGSGPYASRQLINRVESLGSSLDVLTTRDATSITLGVTQDRFDEAMDLLGVVVQKPQFSTTEFTKLKRREMDRLSSMARADAGWAANMVMYRELFGGAATGAGAAHPYAAYDSTPDQTEKRALWEVKQWVQTHFKPANAFLMVAGDVSLSQVRQATERALGNWRGAAPKPLKYSAPEPPNGLRVFLVDRPKSTQAEVRLANLGPERKSETWAAMRVANQILGGGVSGRIFLDVREKQSLAYSAGSLLDDVANGPCPMVLRAGTQTAKAGLTLKALLEHATRLSTEPPTTEEASIATRYLSDVFLASVESVSDVAQLASRLGIFGLPNDYYDRYREAVRNTQAAAAHTAFATHVKPNQGIVVVAGDAARLDAPLSHFAEVHVIDPDRAFTTTRKVPHNPSASIELERIDGT